MEFAVATLIYATHQWSWLYWHQVLTGWVALALLWAALVLSYQLEWRARYALALVFPPVWSYVAIYRLDNFLLATGPAVLFLSLVTLWTGWGFPLLPSRTSHRSRVVVGCAAALGSPPSRLSVPARPWCMESVGYYLDILFLFATGCGILVLVQDELRRGVAALSALSGDLQSRGVSAEALEHSVRAKPDVVLLDLTMPGPGGGGLAVVRALRDRVPDAAGADPQHAR